MTKQTITTEIDIPDGYECVRIGTPLKGEWIVQYTTKGEIYGFNCSYDWKNSPCIIIRPIWQPPAWMRPGWVTADEYLRVWTWHEREPSLSLTGFQSSGAVCCVWYLGQPTSGDFFPPPCDDWRQSKRRIGGGE